jgi:hypothetical protein
LALHVKLDARRVSLAAVFVAPVLLALVLPASAVGDDGLILRQAVVRPGEVVRVWGACGRPIYLISESFAKRSFLYYFSQPAARPPGKRPFRLLGRTVCTWRDHYVGDFPNGDWSSWSGYLRFRVPGVRPGRYQLVVYCAPCRHGPGGSLIINNWLWKGSRRIGPSGLAILADRR